MDVPPRLWDVKNGRAIGKSVEAMQINLAVDKIRVEVNRRYQELIQSDGYVTAAKLRDAYLGIGVKQETLLKLFEQHNVEYRKKVGFSREIATWKKYCCVCKRVREFLAHTYHREDIPLKELNLTFINDFEYFLRTEKKCRTNTVWGYMIVLKHIVAIARNDGRLPFNPFSGYINSPESVDRGYLSQEEIKAVMNYKTANKAHARIRDLFVFSIFTGLAYADVKNLTTDNLQTMFDGELWIITRRKKTNTESRIRLLDIPKRIIEKYADQRLDHHVFYMPCNCHCNDILREIGKNQVRALRVVLSGSPEDMKRIRQAGLLDAWAKDSCGWLQKIFGKENVVSAVLYMDEKTSHIHATVVPIVRGERRKAKLERTKNAQSGKRTYRTKKDRPRLCADDVMARDKLKAYQTTYAEAMAKCGL